MYKYVFSPWKYISIKQKKTQNIFENVNSCKIFENTYKMKQLVRNNFVKNLYRLWKQGNKRHRKFDFRFKQQGFVKATREAKLAVSEKRNISCNLSKKIIFFWGIPIRYRLLFLTLYHLHLKLPTFYWGITVELFSNTIRNNEFFFTFCMLLLKWSVAELKILVQ